MGIERASGQFASMTSIESVSSGQARKERRMSRSAITIELQKSGLPTHRRPTSPGEVIKEEFLVPLQLTQTRLAAAMGIPLQRLNLIINGKRGITPDTARRLSRALGGTAKFWLNLEQNVALYDAIKSHGTESEIERIPRLVDMSAMA